MADEPSVIPSHDPPQPIAAEPAIPPPAVEKKYRLPAGQKVPPAQLHQRAAQRSAERNKPEVKGPERSKEPSQLRYLLLFLQYPPKVLLNHLFLKKAKKRSSAPERTESGRFDTSASGEVAPETLQEDRATQASLEALSHEFSTVPTKN